MKKCNKCYVEKDISAFNKDISKKDGYRNQCKDCQHEYHQKYYNDNRDDINNRIKTYRKNNKEIIKNQSKKYYELNKDNLKLKNREYAKNNREYINARKRIYYKLSNDQKIKRKLYREIKLKNDPLYKLSCSIRCIIYRSIYNKNITKKLKSEVIIGCKFVEFKNYIESKFTEGMSWDNYGKWHLDHIIPISWAKTESEIYDLNYYTNFQPMWAFDNQSKGNRYSV